MMAPRGAPSRCPPALWNVWAGQQPRLRTARTDSQDSPWSLKAEGNRWEAATGLAGRAWAGWEGGSSRQASYLTSGLFITWALLSRRVAEQTLAVSPLGASPGCSLPATAPLPRELTLCTLPSFLGLCELESPCGGKLFSQGKALAVCSGICSQGLLLGS